MNKKTILLAMMSIVLITSACKKNDDPEVNLPGGKGDIAILTIIPNPDGMTGGQFIQLIDGLQPTVDNANAIAVGYGGASPYFNGNDMYVFPSYMGDTKNELVKYTRSNRQFTKAGTLKLPEKSGATNIVQLSAEKAYLGCASIGKIIIFNPQKMEKTGEIDLTSLGIEDKNPDIGAMIIRDGLLYVGLNQMVGGWIPPATYTNSDIAIIDTKTDKLLKMISETTSHISMATRPIDPYCIFADEKNDIYVSCIGAFGMLPGTEHKAGVLRIKSGETEFDQSYKFTITGAAIQGEQKTAGFISSIVYAGNGKAYAYINVPGYYKPGEMGHSAIADRAVEIDLYNKTMKKIDGLELSNGYGVSVAKYNNKIIFGNASEKAKGFYLYDIATQKVSEKPVIVPVGNPYGFHYFGK